MKNQINILIIKESEWWVAQCMEYDIAVQARTLRNVQYEFQRIFFGRLLVAQELGIKPFEDIPPAPNVYRSIFEDASKTLKLELRPIENFPNNIPPAYMLPSEALLYEY